MRAEELRQMSDQELAVKERELKESLFHFRLRRGTNQLESPSALRNTRRDIARIKTILAERARRIREGSVQ
jgi:large subunit ribosomal protein L29